MFAVDKPGCIQVGSSLERQANCGQTLRAIICLLAITGNIERPGSMISWALPETRTCWRTSSSKSRISEETQKNIVGSNTYRLGAARNGPCRHRDQAVAVRATPWSKCGSAWEGNRSSTLANTKEVVPALMNLEFLVHCDQFMGPMAEICRHCAAVGPLA